MCNTHTNSGRKLNKSWMRSGLLGISGMRVAMQAESIGCAIVHESGITATFREYEHSGNHLILHSLQPYHSLSPLKNTQNTQNTLIPVCLANIPFSSSTPHPSQN
jgi:hypothetical protein